MTKTFLGVAWIAFFVAVVPASAVQLSPPTISSISPAQLLAGTAAAEIVVTGTGFVDGSLVRVNNSPIPSTFVSLTSLRASLPPLAMASPSNLSITVSNPNGSTSAGFSLLVYSPNPPALTEILPNFGMPGGAFELTVIGSNLFGATMAISGPGITQVVGSQQVNDSVKLDDCVPYTDHVLPGAMIGSSSSISNFKQFVGEVSNRKSPFSSYFIPSSFLKSGLPIKLTWREMRTSH